MNANILIAEDEIGIRTALTLLLEEEGYVIRTVKDGLEAMEALRGEKYDLLISDIRMPGLSGLELLEEIRKLPYSPEIIMMTAYGTIETAIHALKNGARDFLLKPFSNDLLKMTIRRALELRELSEENKRLRQLERMKKEFITMVAHELRTPLTSIKGYLKLVLAGMAGDLQAAQKEYLTVVQQNGHRLERIVDKMIDIAQIEANEFNLQARVTKVMSVVWEAVGETEQSHQAKHGKIEVNGNPGLKPILVDPNRLKQILSVLLDNAVAFSPPHKPIWVTVDLWKGRDATRAGGLPMSYVDFSDVEDMDYLEIAVRDEGPGIPADKLSLVFEKFYQVEDLYIRQVGGLGVGLSLCKRLVEIMGGKIWVKSNVGEGSIFTVILPWKQPVSKTNEWEVSTDTQAA